MKSEEFDILEKVAYLQRKIGILVLSNKRLIFRPKLTFARSGMLWGGFFILLISVFPLAMGIYFLGNPLPSYAATFSLVILLVGVIMAVSGFLMILWAYLKRAAKETVIELKNIKNFEKKGDSKHLMIMMLNGKRYDFSLQARDEFFNELEIILQDDLDTTKNIPSYMIVNEKLDVPKYSVPLKYPGALVKLRLIYSTPKKCCMCGEPASSKTITAKPKSQDFMKKLTAKPEAPMAMEKPHSPFSHPFPICDNCFGIYNRAKKSSKIGGLIGLIIGGIVFILFLFSNYFFDTLGFIAEFSSTFGPFGDLSKWVFSFLIIIFLTAGTGWIVGSLFFKDFFVFRKVPKEKKEFYNEMVKNGGIRVKRIPGYVAFGFLSNEFVNDFSQMNNGIGTALS